MLKKIILALAVIILLSGCSITYYNYYETESPTEASLFSEVDATWSGRGITPTRCITAYPDSTGKIHYLMESKCKKKLRDTEDYD